METLSSQHHFSDFKSLALEGLVSTPASCGQSCNELGCDKSQAENANL